jgi:hypothetical protein
MSQITPAFGGKSDLAGHATGSNLSRMNQAGHSKGGTLDRLSHLADDAAPGEHGAFMDVGDWLRRLGLEQYEAAFRENKIDDKVLPSLTTEDLKDLGVGFVGDRTRLRYFCSPQRTDSAFYPLIGQFERAAGFAHGDKPQTKLDKLDALLAQTSTSRQDAALLAAMLSLPNDGRYPALGLVPEQRRQRTLAALGVQLETLARASPVLMILEDAHWTTPRAWRRSVARWIGFGPFACC